VQRLRDDKKVPVRWWNAYVARKLETREATHEQREKKRESARKMVSLPSPSRAQRHGKAKAK